MNLPALLATPLILLSAGYTIVLTRTNGEPIEVPSSEIENITFKEDKPENPPTQLVLTRTDGKTVEVSSSDIETITFKKNLPQVDLPTEPEYIPGTTGSIFPPGVSATEGFVDVDKLYTNPWYTTDADDCWACAFSDIMAWWLQDYKAVMGEDYPLVYPLPSESHYVTPVMDATCLAHNYKVGGGDVFRALEWFCVGVEGNIIANGVNKFDESYQYWKGGFLGMTDEEMRSLVLNLNKKTFGREKPEFTYNCLDPAYTMLNKKKFIEKFSKHIIQTLVKGPFYFGVFNHAIACFGADYKVLDDGTPELTALYVCENSKNLQGTGNTINGMEYCPIVFEEPAGEGAIVPWLRMESYNGGSSIQTDIRRTIAVKSIRFKDQK